MRKQGFVYFSMAVLLAVLSGQSAFANPNQRAQRAESAANGGVGRNEDAISAFKNACCGDGVTGAVPGNCDQAMVKAALEQLTGNPDPAAAPGRQGR